MDSEIRIERIPYSRVEADLALPPSASKSFNTSFHCADSLPSALKVEVASQTTTSPADPNDNALPSCPSELPYDFSRWRWLVLGSRRLDHAQVQTISLTRRQAKILLDAMNASIPLGRLNRLHAEDLEDDICPLLRKLDFQNPKGLWMRLDACSPKDGAFGSAASGALMSVEDIVLRLVTSTRARNAIQNQFLDAEQSSTKSSAPLPSSTVSSDEFRLYFLPFDQRMRSENEYRVFCSPGDLQIRAISQYRWHKRWKFADAPEEEARRILGQIWYGVLVIREIIVKEISNRKGETPEGIIDLNHVLIRQGMVFDAVFDEQTEQCDLIELNVFGATGACGSCLFHWVEDWKQLYGYDDDAAMAEGNAGPNNRARAAIGKDGGIAFRITV